MNVYIYALRDPLTHEVRYVGQSANPFSRLLSHTKGGGAAVSLWINKELRRLPDMSILRVVTTPEANEAEAEEIEKQRALGCRLLQVHHFPENQLPAIRARRSVMSVGDQIKPIQVRRRALHLSQRALAAGAGISESYLGVLERGESSPTLRIARSIAECLGTSVDALWPPGSDPGASCEAEEASS